MNAWWAIGGAFILGWGARFWLERWWRRNREHADQLANPDTRP